MKVNEYDYNSEVEGIVSPKRGEELIQAIEMKIKNDSVPHYEILKIGQNDEEFEFLYQYLDEKGIKIRGINITMEEVEGFKRVAKSGANYYNLPEVIEPDLQYQLFEEKKKIKEECLEKGEDYSKDERYIKVRNKLIEGNLRLAKYISNFKEFKNLGLDEDELFDLAYDGLVYSIERFDHTRGNKFSTYGWKAIYGRLERGIANHYGVNTKQYLEYAEIKEIRQTFLEQQDREPSIEEIQQIMGISEKRIKTLLALDNVRVNPESLEGFMYGYEDETDVAIDNIDDSTRVRGYEEGVFFDAQSR